MLESVRLPSDDEQALLEAWLGFALQQNGHHNQGRRVLESVLAQTDQSRRNAGSDGDATRVNADVGGSPASLAHALLHRDVPAMAVSGTVHAPKNNGETR